MPAPGFGVEDFQKVFVEIQDRVIARTWRQQGGIDHIHRIPHHVKRGAQQIENLVLCQCPQCGAQQRVGAIGQGPVGIAVHWLAAGLMRQQQTERQCLGEGIGEQFILVRRSITAGSRVGEQGFPEFRLHGGQFRGRAGAALVQHHLAG